MGIVVMVVSIICCVQCCGCFVKKFGKFGWVMASVYESFKKFCCDVLKIVLICVLKPIFS